MDFVPCVVFVGAETDCGSSVEKCFMVEACEIPIKLTILKSIFFSGKVIIFSIAGKFSCASKRNLVGFMTKTEEVTLDLIQKLCGRSVLLYL